MFLRTEVIKEKKLVGKHARMTLAGDGTRSLWQSFMPRRQELANRLGNDLYSLQVYDPSLDFSTFNPNTVFDKWALAEVADFSAIPDGMEAFTLEPGLYAVFLHKGMPQNFAGTFHYIFGTWLPASDYLLDNRPHFEILGEKYRNDDPASEEEVWIPIR